jgi:hypothetical protein
MELVIRLLRFLGRPSVFMTLIVGLPLLVVYAAISLPLALVTLWYASGFFAVLYEMRQNVDIGLGLFFLALVLAAGGPTWLLERPSMLLKKHLGR